MLATEAEITVKLSTFERQGLVLLLELKTDQITSRKKQSKLKISRQQEHFQRTQSLISLLKFNSHTDLTSEYFFWYQSCTNFYPLNKKIACKTSENQGHNVIYQQNFFPFNCNFYNHHTIFGYYLCSLMFTVL